MSVEKQILKNLWEDIKVASKDSVDMTLLVLFIIGSYFDLMGNHVTRGTVAFMTFYIICLLIRKAGIQRMLESNIE